MASAEDHDCGRAFQNRFILGVASLRDKDGLHVQSRFVQRVGEDHVSGTMLVLQSPMTGLTGNEHDLCFVCSIACTEQRNGK